MCNYVAYNRFINFVFYIYNLKRRNSPSSSIALDADYVTVVEDRPKISAEYRLPLLAKTDPPCNALSLR